MEKVIYRSPKKHRILIIKNYLEQNSIQISSVKIHIYVKWSRHSKGGVQVFVEEIERSDELNVPIEEFSGKLNDAQTFELYVDEQHEYRALALIEECDQETFFNDCILKSKNYDEAFEIYLLLRKKGIPCDDVATVFRENGDEEHLLFSDPENKENALKIIDDEYKIEEGASENYEVEQEEMQEESQEKLIDRNYNKPNGAKYIWLVIIIACVLLFRIDNEFVVEIIIKKLAVIIDGFVKNGHFV